MECTKLLNEKVCLAFKDSELLYQQHLKYDSNQYLALKNLHQILTNYCLGIVHKQNK